MKFVRSLRRQFRPITEAPMFRSMSASARGDLLVIAIISIAAYIASIQLDLFDNVVEFLATHEEYEVDEVLSAIIIASFALVGFASRRMAESVQNLKLRVEAEEHNRSMAMHDALTGLPNRRKLQGELADALSGASAAESVAVVAIDLDRFKPVNDLYGHAAGDALLIAIAKMLCEEAGQSGFVARIGGDEFILVLRKVTRADDLLAHLTRLVTMFETPMQVAGNYVAVGATMGVSLAHSAEATSAEMLRRADIALYRAKGEGRGRFAFFEDSMDEQVQARLELERQLRAAVAREAVEPFYQPLVHLDDGETYGYELLARMRREDGSLIPPDQFIELAEEIGLIGEMTMSLMRRACAEVLGWPGAPLLSVNISPVQLRDPVLPQKILQVLTETGYPAARLQVEITESALVADLDQARTILTSLRNQGVRIALDDFGTGYSSLRHLRELPFDNLKIDRSFVQTMGSSAESETIVHTILDLADNLGLAVTAEGIETQADAQSLKALGCKSGQGFLYGRPADAEHIRETFAVEKTHPFRKESDAA